jgi:RNA polymerase-interacting CarD/CdnL/TRCF family regulator
VTLTSNGGIFVQGRLLGAGDAIYHPRYGFGTVMSVSRQSITGNGSRGPGDGPADGVQDYYEIELMEGGTLLVPVAKADAVGLRRLSNRLEDIETWLRSPAEALPVNSRERVVELRSRDQAVEPGALAQAVRDLIPRRQRRSLTATEKLWLDRACERLSQEAALVESIPVPQARAAIWQIIETLSVP